MTKKSTANCTATRSIGVPRPAPSAGGKSFFFSIFGPAIPPLPSDLNRGKNARRQLRGRVCRQNRTGETWRAPGDGAFFTVLLSQRRATACAAVPSDSPLVAKMVQALFLVERGSIHRRSDTRPGNERLPL